MIAIPCIEVIIATGYYSRKYGTCICQLSVAILYFPIHTLRKLLIYLILLLFQQGITFSLRHHSWVKAQKLGLLVQKSLLRLENVFSSGITCTEAALVI